MKIFLGMINISSQINDYVEGFHKLGVETMTAIIYQSSPIIDCSNIDYNIDLMIKEYGDTVDYNQKQSEILEYLLAKAIRECDIFIFFWRTFRPDNSDLALLKSKGKKIVVIMCGDEVRWKPACDQEFEKFNFPLMEYSNYFRPGNTITTKLRYLRNVEFYADQIYSQPTMSHLSLRAYNKLNVSIHTDLFIENNSQRRIPHIIHAPSNKAIKGTKYVMEAVDRLKKENVEFEFNLLVNVPNKEALLIYSDTDILVGQLFGVIGGKQEREALACGCVVLSGCKKDYYNMLAEEYPVINVTPETIYVELKKMILNYELRCQIATLGRPYISKYHDSLVICQKVIDNTPPEMFPTFFREEYIPESYFIASECNQYTQIVKSCSWYKQTIAPGFRDGFEF